MGTELINIIMPIVGIVLAAYLRQMYVKVDDQDKRIRDLDAAVTRKDEQIRQIGQYAARLAGRQDANIRQITELRKEITTLTAHNNDLARLLMMARNRIEQLQQLHENERESYQQEIQWLKNRITSLESERDQNRLEIQRLRATLGLKPDAPIEAPAVTMPYKKGP